MFSTHVTKDISTYCHGELSNEESKRFAEHIISCAKCRAKFEEVKLGVKLAERLPQLSAPDYLWRDLEPLLAQQTPASNTVVNSVSLPWQLKAAAAVVLLFLSGLTAFLVYNSRTPQIASGKPSWHVTRLGGAPRIGSEQIANNGQLGVGEWLETDGSSRAQIAVGSIGNVDIDENTRVRLLQTEPTEHRLELARGKMSAHIWAPPRLFFVDTPSAVAADLGCAYTLEVDDHGGSLLRVTSGWVALELKDRESIVPAGAACETRPGIGPGTPYYEDAPTVFREALRKIDFEHDASALTALLDQARSKDTLTLWHLLARVNGDDRVRVYEKMAAFVPPPPGVTREGILQLDQQMLDKWKNELESSWTSGKGVPKPIAEAYWKVKNGLSRRLKEMAPK
ncbi:MAG TPA: FecR domain-containing protein [Pyrinomonadaceae bacterium]|nr:FecR domain-containing protein [Pyrinomonadaceae bacterium]